MAEPGKVAWSQRAAALAALALGALMVGAPSAAGPAPRTSGTAGPASGQVVVHPSRDVAFTIDDRWGQSAPIVHAVDSESSGLLWVYNHDVQPRDGAALLDFALPSVPEVGALSSARLRLYAEDVFLTGEQPTRTLWATGNATAWDPAAMAGQPVPPECCGSVPWLEASRQPGWIAWDVSAIVAGWYAGAPNHGLRIKPSGHAVSDHYYYSFSGMEGPHPPELVLDFGPLATETAEPTTTPTATPPAYGAWSTTGPMLYPREQHSAVALPDGRVLVAGGSAPGPTYPKIAEVYDPTTNEWSEAGEMSSARLWHTALLTTNGRILVIGGYDPTRGSREAPVWPPPEVFDPVSRTWSVLPTDVQADYGSSQVLLPDGRVLLSGFVQGRFCSYYGNALSKTLLLDPTTGGTVPGPDMEVRRTKHWSAELADGKVLLGGGLATYTYLDETGRCTIAPGPQRLVEVFDPATDGLRQVAYIPEDPVRDAVTVPNGNSNHQLRLRDGRIMVTNGLDDTYTPKRLPALLYSPAEEAWSTIPWGSVGRTNPLAALLPNGFVLFVSGRAEDSPIARSAELYDPTSGGWLWAGGARRQYTALYDTATALPDGRVLVVGSGHLSSRSSDGDHRAELYEFGEPVRGRVYAPTALTDQ